MVKEEYNGKNLKAGKYQNFPRCFYVLIDSSFWNRFDP